MRMKKLLLVKQSEVAECGLACLTMIVNFHGASTDLPAMRVRFAPSLRGTSLRSIMEASNSLGLIPRAIQLPLDEIKDLDLPAIMHWDMNHYVVLERVNGSKYLIHDPGHGTSWITAKTLSEHFTGVALEFRPTDSFRAPPSRPRLKLFQLWSRIHGIKRTAAQILVLSTVIELLGLATPYYLQIGIDNVVPSADTSLLTQLGMVFIALIVIQGAVTLLRSIILVRAGSQVGFSLTANLARHMLRLPSAWFQRRMLGDIVGRVNAVDPIQDTLTRGATLTIVDGLFAVITLTVMAAYSIGLTAIVAIGVGLDLAIKGWLSGRQIAAEQTVIEAYAKEQTTVIECLRGITSIRMLGKERERQSIWQNHRSDVVNARTLAGTLRSQGDAVVGIISGIENVISVWLAMIFVIGGSLTAGMVFAFFALKAMFVAKAKSLIDQTVQIRLLRLYLDRIGDVVLEDEDSSFADHGVLREGGRFEKITLEGVSYRYSPTDPYVLQDINLTIRFGDHVAITGDSGGGKSTLIRILLGLVEPTEGAVRIDGLSLREYSVRQYHKIVSAVVQDDTLFTGTLAENISMFDEEFDLDRVEHSAMLAAIDRDIEVMPMKYNTLVGDMGSTLSSGQRQRILIARALYRRPALLVMDEGTSHLDSRHEALIARSLEGLAVTRVTVAHREETLRHATARYRLDNGRLHSDQSHRD